MKYSIKGENITLIKNYSEQQILLWGKQLTNIVLNWELKDKELYMVTQQSFFQQNKNWFDTFLSFLPLKILHVHLELYKKFNYFPIVKIYNN